MISRGLRNFVHCCAAVIGVVRPYLYVWNRAGLRASLSRFEGLRRVRHSPNATGPLDCDPPKTWPGSPASWANFLRLPGGLSQSLRAYPGSLALIRRQLAAYLPQRRSLASSVPEVCVRPPRHAASTRQGPALLPRAVKHPLNVAN
jgi:hypothetical protein